MVFLIISLHLGFEDNLGAHRPFIKESENRQEDYCQKLIRAVRIEEYGICDTKGNSKLVSLKLSRLDIYYVMMLIIYVCCDYINCLYD